MISSLPIIPPLSGSPVFGASSLPRWELLKGAKQSLVQSGLHEALNFAFTSKAWLSRFEMTSSVLVSNPLSEEHESNGPFAHSWVGQKYLNNWNHHFGSEPLAIRLFEIRPVFSAAATGQTEDQRKRTGIEEHWRLALVLSGPRYSEALRSERGEVDFYDLKGVIDIYWRIWVREGYVISLCTLPKVGSILFFIQVRALKFWRETRFWEPSDYSILKRLAL